MVRSVARSRCQTATLSSPSPLWGGWRATLVAQPGGVTSRRTPPRCSTQSSLRRLRKLVCVARIFLPSQVGLARLAHSVPISGKPEIGGEGSGSPPRRRVSNSHFQTATCLFFFPPPLAGEGREGARKLRNALLLPPSRPASLPTSPPGEVDGDTPRLPFMKTASPLSLPWGEGGGASEPGDADSFGQEPPHPDPLPSQVGPARLAHSIVLISGKPRSWGEEKTASISGPCFCQATGAPVFFFLPPSNPRERSAVRRTVKVSAPRAAGGPHLSARAACVTGIVGEQRRKRTRPTALHWRRFWASGPCFRARKAGCSPADPAAHAAFLPHQTTSSH